VSDDSLFPDLAVPAAVPERISAGRRLTLRQKRDVELGRHPLTGGVARPELGTCGDCALRSLEFGRFPKCLQGYDPDRRPRVAGPYMTHGAATDVRRWWPACGQFVPRGAANTG
jgi:hypothetical protein